MKKQRLISHSGYTLLEVMLAVAIAMIIAGWGVVNVHDVVLKQKGQAAAIGLYKELTGLPALARKLDKPFMVKFDDATETYQVYKDENEDGNADAGEEYNKHSIEKPDIIIAPPNGVNYGPDDLPFHNSGVAGSWRQGSTDKSFKIQNDNLNTMNSGAVYIQNTSLPQFGFCIGVEPNSRTIKIYTWAGGQWNEY